MTSNTFPFCFVLLRLLCRSPSVNQRRCSKSLFLSLLFSSSLHVSSTSLLLRHTRSLIAAIFSSHLPPHYLPTHSWLRSAPPLARLPPQYLSALARCSASSRPPPSWRRSISRVPGARIRCRPATGSTSCRGRRTGPRCFMSTPPGTTTDRTGPPPPTSECVATDGWMEEWGRGRGGGRRGAVETAVSLFGKSES